MRNPFDQYIQPENKLTHALVSSLAQDKELLHKFIHWITYRSVPKKEKLYIIEQSLPGQLEESEDESTKKGLPDACVFDDNDWILIIESKVASRVSLNQLERHINTLKKRGFADIHVLVVNTDKNIAKLPRNTSIKTWSEIYEWGYGHIKKSVWAKLFTEYFETAEAKMIKEEYLKEGTLTKFTGIHFDYESPYSYNEAKRLLKLLISELKADIKLVKVMGIDAQSAGRGGITGQKGHAVWDFLRIVEAKGAKNFTQYPHVTLGILDTRSEVYITIPHGIKREIFKNLFGKDFNSFKEVMSKTLKNMEQIIRKNSGVKPYIQILQRHYRTQRETPFVDAKLVFDLRTAFNAGKKSQIKRQQQWLDVAYDVVRNKKSNMQFQVGIEFAYDRCTAIRGEGAINVIKDSIRALKPFLDMAMGR